MNPTLLSSLACPRCGKSLQIIGRGLVCSKNHTFPIRDDVGIFAAKVRKDNYDDEAFAQFYLQTHYRDTIGGQLKRKSLQKLDLSGFFRAPHTSYYEDLAGMLGGKITRRSAVLDLGCSVGRLSFECAKHAGRVFGIDPSFLHVRLAREILRKQKLTVSFGQSLAVYNNQKITTVSVPVNVPTNTEFFVGDDSTLPFADESVGAIVSSAVIDRVPDCHTFLKNAARVIRPGGYFLISAPFQWYAHLTSPKNWLGKGAFGTRPGSPERALEELMSRLGFRLERRKDIPWETSIDRRYFITWNVYAGLFEKR